MARKTNGRLSNVKRCPGVLNLLEVAQRVGTFVGALLLVLLLIAVVVKLSKPYIISYGEQKEIARLKREKIAKEALKKRLMEEKAYWSTEQGQEELARSYGYVKDSEIPVWVPNAKSNPWSEETPVVDVEAWWQVAAYKTLKVFVRTGVKSKERPGC